MNKQASQKWLDRLYTVRDVLVGWCYRNIQMYQDFERYATTPWRTWTFWLLRMRYIFDEVDHAASPEETWLHGGGDCEDMAWFCRDRLRKLGFEAHLFRAEWDKLSAQGIKAHITCIFRPFSSGSWGYMGTGSNEYRAFGLTWREIAERMVGNRDLVEYGTMDVDSETRKLTYTKKIEVNS